MTSWIVSEMVFVEVEAVRRVISNGAASRNCNVVSFFFICMYIYIVNRRDLPDAVKSYSPLHRTSRIFKPLLFMTCFPPTSSPNLIQWFSITAGSIYPLFSQACSYHGCLLPPPCLYKLFWGVGPLVPTGKGTHF